MSMTLAPQASLLSYMQGTAVVAATVNSIGASAHVDGCTGAQQVEIVESGGGTATITLEGSLDQTNWYSVGYQQVDGVAAPARAVAAISVLASSKHVYQVLDPYMFLRARMTAIAGGGAVTARVYVVPA